MFTTQITLDQKLFNLVTYADEGSFKIGVHKCEVFLNR